MAAGANDQMLKGIFDAALSAHQAGHLAQAVAGYRRLLGLAPGHVPTKNLLGVALTQSGQVSEGIKFLKAAVKGMPNNPTFHFNLANAELAAKQDRKALQALEKALSLNPKYPEALLNRANLLERKGDFTRAEADYRAAITLVPAWPMPRLNLAVLLTTMKRGQEALTLLDGLPEEVNTLNIKGSILRSLGRAPDAIPVFQAALAQAPENAETLSNLGSVLAETGHLEEARGHLEAAVQKSQDKGARLNLAKLYFKLSLTDEALGLLDGLIAEEPTNPATRLQRALILEMISEVEAARVDTEAGLRVAPKMPELLFIAALLDRREGNLAGALDRLDAIDADAIAATPLASQTTFERARVLDRLDRFEEAFATFEAANARAGQSEEITAALEADDRLMSGLEAFAAAGSCKKLRRPDVSEEGAEETPVFLVGFPRSGTTLLDRALDGQPALTVLEENPLLPALVQSLQSTDEGYPGALLTMSDAQKDGLRAEYHTAARKEAPTGSGRLVDKLPLNSLYLPLIHQVFPGAPVIFALRHPMDCVLSCFMQDFQLNAAMVNYLSLDNAARHYDRVMSIATGAIDDLALQPIFVRYEDLVADFDGTVQNTVEALGLAWVKPEKDLAARVKGQKVNTPSYSQIAEPVYQRATGRWKNYTGPLQTVEARLAPWVRYWGYSAG